MHFNKLPKAKKVKALAHFKDQFLWALTHHNKQTLKDYPEFVKLNRFIVKCINLAEVTKIVEKNPTLQDAVNFATLRLARKAYYIPMNDEREYVRLRVL